MKQSKTIVTYNWLTIVDCTRVIGSFVSRSEVFDLLQLIPLLCNLISSGFDQGTTDKK